MAQPDPENVLAWWLGDSASDPAQARARTPVWFGANTRVDAEIRRRFATTAAAAARGELSDWADSPRSCLALAIALDQFPRNLFRGTPAAFAQDRHALALSRAAVGRGFVLELGTVEQAFLLMPYQHAESRTMQRRGVALFEAMARRATAPWQSQARRFAHFAREHAGIVERFGRFPHRNPVLGRQSSAAELHYLRTGGKTYGQGD